MAISIGGIVCEELREGFEEGVGDSGANATKKFLCNWADRYTVADAIMFRATGTGTGGPVTITSPMPYPESPNMLAREIAIEGRGKYTQGPIQGQFAQAVVSVNYGVPTWGAIPLPNMSFDPGMPFVYATQDIDFSREMVTIPKSSVKLANGHKLKDLPYAFPLVHAIMTIQLHRVPFLPAAQILTSMQKPLNNSTFLGVASGHLMFAGCHNHMEALSDGTQVQELTYVFDYRSILAHDEVFDPDGTSGPQQVQNNSGTPILQRSNLAALIPSAYGGGGA